MNRWAIPFRPEGSRTDSGATGPRGAPVGSDFGELSRVERQGRGQSSRGALRPPVLFALNPVAVRQAVPAALTQSMSTRASAGRACPFSFLRRAGTSLCKAQGSDRTAELNRAVRLQRRFAALIICFTITGRAVGEVLSFNRTSYSCSGRAICVRRSAKFSWSRFVRNTIGERCATT